MKSFMLVALGLLDITCLSLIIYLWRISKYSGAEIGNIDWGLAKVFGVATLAISVLIALIFFYKK
jgi:hypothetical protein